MRSCSCGSSSGIRVVEGPGIEITGSGTPTDPLIIGVEQGTTTQTFTILDTPTVNLTLVGAGTTIDPYILSAVATVGMGTLSDVDDPAGPAVGDVPVFNGSKWEFAKPPTQAPGLVNATAGITGDGTVTTPLKVNVADLATTSTSGLASYIDSAGKLRVVAPTPVTSIHWDNVTNKPSQYPDAAKLGGRNPWTYSTSVPSNANGLEGDLHIRLSS